MHTVRVLAVFSVFFVYLDAFYWFKIFDKYAIVVRVLENTIKSVTIFTILLLLVVLMFTNVVYLLKQNRLESDSDFNDFHVGAEGWNFLTTFVTEY